MPKSAEEVDRRQAIAERLAQGHTGKRRTREERLAAGWRFDPEMEQLEAMKTGDPTRFARVITPDLRIQLGHYASAREAAKEFGIDTSKGGSNG